MNFSQSFRESVSVHYKDRADMVAWLNETVEMMIAAGCTEQSCVGANISLMLNLISEKAL